MVRKRYVLRFAWVLLWPLLFSGCAPKEFFYFSAPRPAQSIVKEPPIPNSIHSLALDTVPASQPIAIFPGAAPLSAEVGEPTPVLLPPFHRQVVISPSVEAPLAQASATPTKQRRFFPALWEEPRKPYAGTAKTALFLGIAAFTLTIAGLANLANSGVILLIFALVMALGGIFSSLIPKAWNKKHPDNPISTKGTNLGFVLSLASLTLIAIFVSLLFMLSGFVLAS